MTPQNSDISEQEIVHSCHYNPIWFFSVEYPNAGPQCSSKYFLVYLTEETHTGFEQHEGE